MDEAWNGKFGPGVEPPEWVFGFSSQDFCGRQHNVDRKIVESESRVRKLREKLEHELFLLAWLKEVRESDSEATFSCGIGDKAEDSEQNHVQDDVFEKTEGPNSSCCVPRGPVTADKCCAGIPDTASGEDPKLLTGSSSSEDITSSSEYHTAGQNSSPESLSQHTRQRSIRQVSNKESSIAEEVRLRVHQSCQDLNKPGQGFVAPVGKHRRNSSAPLLGWEPPPQSGDPIRLSQDLATSCEEDLYTNGCVAGGCAEQAPLNNSTESRVVLREKLVRRPSFPMSYKEDINQWKGTGGFSTKADRSSNGVPECGNYLVNDGEESDPALINVIASRMRGSLRTPRTSVSTDDGQQVTTNGGSGADVGSPTEDLSHTPIPNLHTAPPLRKRDRISYHYSDDECLTPKIDSGGDHSSFSGVSPSDSNRCSHRNSRNSNGIIDEKPYDLTLQRDSPVVKTERKNTVTAKSVEKVDRFEDSTEKRHSFLTNTLTDTEDTEDIFTRSSDSFSKLGDLGLDVELTLSKLRDKPEMSMATLLDTNENRKMNQDLTLEDYEYEESIEIDEATISAYTLSNDMYGLRSTSASSIPGLYSDLSGASPPEFDSPAHQGVSLRQGCGVNRLNRKRPIDLEMMTGGPSSDNDDISRSSTSLTSEEEVASPSEDNLSPGSRTSRVYPVRHSTVVVHGEQLVIRKLVIVGVVSAEKTYIECLSVMKEYYRKPLLAVASSSQPIIGEKDIGIIFHSIEALHQVHSTLHEQLECMLAEWSVRSCVGEFFVQLCHNLKVYKEYVEMYQKSIECLNRNKAEFPLFKRFLEDVHMTVANTNKDIPKINELLRRPVERLQSYSLVLHDLCQHTPIDHPDHRILRDSLQAMSAFITSTHDPQAFRELSGGFNRELLKEGLVVELSEGFRKVRRLFLFHDVLVSAKQKPTRTSMKFEPKWYLPLKELKFKCPSNVAKKPVPVTSEMELRVMKNKVAELRAQHSSRERASSTSGEGFNIRRNIFMIKYGSNKQSERVKKKLQEQQVSYWIASPSLPLRLYGNNGKQFMFLLHNEEEQENWISAIKKLIPKAVINVSLTSFELQDLMSRQTINDLRKVEEMIVPTADDEYLSGVLRVRVMAATEIKAKPVGLYCCLELDEYGKFERKARTLPTNTDGVTLVTTWDQDFEVELVGSHTMKLQVCSKSLLKEETYAQGKVRLPIKELRQNKRQKLQISLTPQGVITLVIEYFANMASLNRKPTLLSSGVFGVPIEVVAKRERHDIPLIVQTCVDEVEKRGLSEVGVYRVAGVLRDVQELRLSFDTDYIKAQMIAYETDIHAVAGLLKRYFRELPDPLFTDDLYISFVQALGLSDPEARDQCLLSLLHSLPPVNFKTACFLFLHLRGVAANSSVNKMTLTNLATIFGPNLLRPGGAGLEINIAAMDVVTPVSVVLYYLNCPEEYFEEGPNTSKTSPTSTEQGRGTGDRRGNVGMAPDPDPIVLRRGSNTHLSPKEQSRHPEEVTMVASPVAGGAAAAAMEKNFKRTRRASSRASKTASTSSIRSSASVKNTSTSSVASVANSRESII